MCWPSYYSVCWIIDYSPCHCPQSMLAPSFPGSAYSIEWMVSWPFGRDEVFFLRWNWTKPSWLAFHATCLPAFWEPDQSAAVRSPQAVCPETRWLFNRVTINSATAVGQRVYQKLFWSLIYSGTPFCLARFKLITTKYHVFVLWLLPHWLLRSARQFICWSCLREREPLQATYHYINSECGIIKLHLCISAVIVHLVSVQV